jgi:hypothetical protein
MVGHHDGTFAQYAQVGSLFATSQGAEMIFGSGAQGSVERNTSIRIHPR